MRKKIYALPVILLLCLQGTFAQQKYIVNATVFDSQSGKPIPNVTVKTLLEGRQTVSNIVGQFTIPVTITDTLLFTCAEYQDLKMPVSSKEITVVVMKQLNVLLDDVTINTGYQKLKPNEVNGSYVVIDNKMLNQQTGTNILDRLNGVTSSLLVNMGKHNQNPQNNTNISIRGLSTINGPLDPLIVVDNFIYDGDIRNINPNDVENVTVLKDATATSIWGARAGNGVIVITTKKGKFNQPLQVEFNTNVILIDKPDLYALPHVSSSDYIDFEQFLFNKGYFNNQFTSNSHPAISPAVQIFEDRRNGIISSGDSAQQINLLKQYDNRDQYTKYYYQRGMVQDYALNMHGGGPNLSWLLSGSYNKSNGNQREQNDKANFSFQNSYKLLKNIIFQAGVYYTNSTSTTGLPGFNQVTSINGNRAVPYLALAGSQGEPIAVPSFYNLRYLDTLGNNKLLDWNYYPLNDYKHNITRANTEELIARTGLSYSNTKGFGISLLYQYQKQKIASQQSSDTSSYYARNLINTFSQLNPTTGTVNHIVPVGGILNKSYTDLSSYNFRGQVDFNKTINKIHHLSAIAGTEIRDEWISTGSNSYYGYNADPLTYTNALNFLDYFPTVMNSYAKISSNNFLSSREYRFVSFYSNFSYSYKTRYIFSGSIRKDGSNIFGANTNDKWKPLWSTGIGWELSKEDFYKIAWMPFLKFTATYGVSGNVDLSKSAVPIAILNTSSITNLPAEQIIVINNPDLSWEHSYQTNIRVDFALLRNRLTGSIEYYHKKGTNLYGPKPYDYTAGGIGSTVTANIADIKGNGVDITLRSLNIDRNFKWTTNYIFSYNKTITTSYYSSSSTSIINIGSGNSINPIIGKPLYAIAAYKWGGLDSQGNPRGYLNKVLSTDYNAMQFSDNSFVYMGAASPLCFGSVFNEISWKGIALSFNIVYKFGYYLFKPSISYTSLANNGTGTSEFNERWQHPGDELLTNVPSLVYPLNGDRDAFYAGSEMNVIKGDHLRLQFVNASYTFQKNEKMLFNSLQLYVNIANIGILWRANKDRIDPDYVNNIPVPTTYTIGLRGNF